MALQGLQHTISLKTELKTAVNASNQKVNFTFYAKILLDSHHDWYRTPIWHCDDELCC